MPKDPAKLEDWAQEQTAKSLFFHQKLHEWGLLEVARAIEAFDGSRVEWNLQDLCISEHAWNRVIHGGIAPVRVFAHPAVLQLIARSVGYYRMLAMVSQKSMKNVGLDTEPYEQSKAPDEEVALRLARHLNRIICRVVETETDPRINAREIDLWRGMAAGSQAQGAWQNAKGSEYETVVRQLLTARLVARDLVDLQDVSQLILRDGRKVIFGADPDIAMVRESTVLAAVEVKGGIDPAGAHERLGASIKTLRSTADTQTFVSITARIADGTLGRRL
jgi:hypothetical protein